MSKTLYSLSLIFLIGITSVIAQNPWSLQDCIKYAEENSIAIQQAQLNIQSALLDKKQSQMSRLPDLNGSINGGAQFGRTIDPTTNSFDNQTIGFNRLSLSSNMTIFNGGRINNAIKSANASADIARLNGDVAANDLRLNIASAYLGILMAEENLRNAQSRRDLSKRQLDQMQRFILAGSRPANDSLNVKAQLAIDNQTIIQAQNNLELAYLNLRNLMRLPDDQPFSIIKPELENPDESVMVEANFGTVYNAALNTQPQIKVSDKQVMASQIVEDIEKSGYYPQLSAFASLNSNWSSAARTINGFNDVILYEDFYLPTLFPGQPENPVAIGIEQRIPNLQDQPYFDQIDQNFGQTVGLQLVIPIYNNHQVITRSEKARINTLQAQNNAELARQQLKTDVQNAVANARAAKQTFDAAKISLDANQVAFDNAEKRFNLGAISTFELGNSRTNLDLAQTEYIRSKYDFIFQLKVVEFYLGKDLKF
ncbi:MAG: TolC family protein [Saprospiraceae bacterium]